MAKKVAATRGRKPVEPKAVEPKSKERRPAGLLPAPASGAPSPFALMRRLAEEMDRVLEPLRCGTPSLLSRFDLPWEARESAWLPNLEIAERGGRLVVRADLPGLTKDDVKVELRDDALCIEGERRQEREEKRKGLYRSERTYGRFYREVPLPEGVDPERATASFKNGVLEVTMPAPPRQAKGRRVPIEQA